MEDMKNKNSFLITCMTCIVLLLVMCYFGINSVSNKGTLAADATYTCASGYNVIDNNGSPYCCPSSYGKDATILSHNGSYYCVPSDVEILASGNSDPVCVYEDFVTITLTKAEKEAYDSFAFYCGSMCPGSFLEQKPTIASKFRVPYGSGWSLVGLPESCRMPATSDNKIECNYFESTISKGCVAKATLTEQNDKKACFSYKDKRPSDKKEFTVYAWLSESEYRNNSAYTLQSQYTTSAACDAANSKSCYRCSYNDGYIHDYVFDFTLPYPQKCDTVSVSSEAACKSLVAYKGTFMNGSTVHDTKVCSASGSGASCSMPVPSEPSKSDYTFEGWGDSDGCTSGTKSAFSVTSNVTKYACFKKVSSGGSGGGTSSETHRVTFKDHDGTTLGSDTCTTTTGSCKVNALSTNPSRTGYTFDGWSYGGNSCSKLWHNTLTVSGSISVYACYTENQPSGGGTGTTPQSYTISYNANGGTGTMASHTCTVGSTCTIKGNEFVRSGHKFMGWTTNSNGTKDGYGWTGWSGTWKAEYANGSHGISNNKLILYAMWDKTSTNQNTDTNPQTGEITIFLTWIVGIAAIVYSVWYFKNMKHINN